MKKLTALAVFVALTLTACGSPADTPAQFRETIQHSGTSYANMPDADLDEMAKQICEHYADGFTTQDLRDANGERLASAGEAALSTVCKPR